MNKVRTKAIVKAATGLFLCGATAILIGCQAAPAEKTVWLENGEVMKKIDGLPFQKAWKDPNTNIRAQYNEVIIAPIYTKAHLEKSWLEKQNIRRMVGAEDSDAHEFAQYVEEAFKKAFRESKKIKLVDKPSPKAIIIELALVKVVPGKPIVKGIGNLTNLSPIGFILMPLKVGAQASTDSGMQSSVAIEGRIRDSMTGKVLGMLADRRKQNAAIFNFNDFRAYGNARQIADEWAKEFVTLMEKGSGSVDEKMPLKVINY